MPGRNSRQRRNRIKAIDADISSYRPAGRAGPRLADLSAEELWLVVDGVHDAVEGGSVDPRLAAYSRALGELSSALGVRSRRRFSPGVQDVAPNVRRKIVVRKAWS